MGHIECGKALSMHAVSQCHRMCFFENAVILVKY